MDTLAADGVQHVEFRAFLGPTKYDLIHPEGYFNGDSTVRYYQEVLTINQGIVYTISSDDPGVLGYKGVTPDYGAIFLAWALI